MSTHTADVREAALIISVSPAVFRDAPMLEAVKSSRARELTGMFSVVTSPVHWSEPEPLWRADVGDGLVDYLPRHLAGGLAAFMPDLYRLRASARGVPA